MHINEYAQWGAIIALYVAIWDIRRAIRHIVDAFPGYRNAIQRNTRDIDSIKKGR